jgi:hypothetical protein
MESLRDVHTGPALTTQDLHKLGDELVGPARRVVRTGRAVAQASATFLLITKNPLASRMGIDFELGRGRVQSLLSGKDDENQLLSTKEGKSGILVDVHSVVFLRGDCFSTISFSGFSRMDNLLKSHMILVSRRRHSGGNFSVGPRK